MARKFNIGDLVYRKRSGWWYIVWRVKVDGREDNPRISYSLLDPSATIIEQSKAGVPCVDGGDIQPASEALSNKTRQILEAVLGETIHYAKQLKDRIDTMKAALRQYEDAELEKRLKVE
jgi:hypothetical protein